MSKKSIFTSIYISIAAVTYCHLKDQDDKSNYKEECSTTALTQSVDDAEYFRHLVTIKIQPSCFSTTRSLFTGMKIPVESVGMPESFLFLRLHSLRA